MLKIMKERNKFVKYVNEFLKLSLGLERLLYFSLLFFLLCHINACLWYLVAKLQDLDPESWVVQTGMVDAGNFDVISHTYSF